MSIAIKAMKQRDDKRQIAFITLAVNQEEYEFSVGNVPSSLKIQADILAYLEKREDEFKLLILGKSYPEADINSIPQKEEATEIEKWNAWISKGHKNLIGKKGRKNIYEVIEKQELEYRHPKWIGLTAKIESASIDKEIKDLLKELVK